MHMDYDTIINSYKTMSQHGNFSLNERRLAIPKFLAVAGLYKGSIANGKTQICDSS